MLVGLQMCALPMSTSAVWMLRLCCASLAFTELFGVVALLGEDPPKPRQDRAILSRPSMVPSGFDALGGPGTNLRPVIARARRRSLRSFGLALASFALFAIFNS